MTPFSSLSKRANTLLIPSLVFVSPTLEQMMSKNSGKEIGLFLSRRPWIKERIKGFLLSSPNSSSTLLIQAGSMVPLPSQSKISKVCLRSSQSSASSLSFHDGCCVCFAGCAGCAFAVLLICILNISKFKWSLSNQTNQQIGYQWACFSCLKSKCIAANSCSTLYFRPTSSQECSIALRLSPHSLLCSPLQASSRVALTSRQPSSLELDWSLLFFLLNIQFCFMVLKFYFPMII